jgi:catechol 2,3-dioxygenase-like lactoylglutathione lyase family enzyme
MAPTFNGIGHAAADMAATLAFYRKLGLDIPAGADQEPHAEALLPGGVRLMWDTYDTLKSFEPDWTPPKEPGGSLAFLCADAAEVAAVYADMVKAGYDGHHEPWNAEWGQRYAVLRDPDGNGVDLFAWLPSAATG